ncbi:hypothetical protein [Devosia sp.]|uniref:hypothetical protein n=1 Tax=Devosia sp. TaxID=1871048 RepID=UPI003A95A273
MSDTSSLNELARFVGQSSLTTNDTVAHGATVAAMARRLQPRRSVGELLGAVLALSARTRRMLLPPAEIDLDVFTPKGGRAVRIVMPHRQA